MTQAILLLLLSVGYVDGPQKTAPVRKASIDLNVVVVPPTDAYDVTIKPKTPPAAGTVAVWQITPRKGITTISRTRSEWHLKAKPGHYEVLYTTIIGEDQNDSYYEFDIGEPPEPPTPVVVDPFQPAINVAFAKDSPVDPAAKVAAAKKYAAYYRAAAATCYASQAANTDQLWTEIQAVENGAGIDLKAILGCRAILKSQMAALYPQGASATAPCDKTKRDATGAMYARFAALLEGAVK